MAWEGNVQPIGRVCTFMVLDTQPSNRSAMIWTKLNPGLALLLAAFGLFNNATAQWEPTNGPNGRNILSMAQTAADLYAGAFERGFYHSVNDGATWTTLNDGLPSSTSVQAIAITASGLTIGTNTGVYRLEPGSTSWVARNNGLGADPSVYSLMANGPVLFATDFDHVFRSMDDGASWQAINNGLEEQDCADCPDGLYMAGPLLLKDSILFMGTQHGIMRTADDGDNWAAANQGLGGSGVSALATNGSAIFAGSGSRVYRSYDNGNNWGQLAAPWPVNNIQSLACSGPELFVGFWNSGVYHSLDEGENWTEFNHNLVNRTVNVLMPAGPWLFCGMLNGGIARTAIGSPDWSFMNDGFPPIGVLALGIEGASLLAGSRGAGAYMLGPDGLSWSLSSTDLTNGTVLSLGQVQGRMYAGMPNGLYQRESPSAPWASAGQMLEGNAVTCLASQNGFLFAGSPAGIFRSTVGESDWDILGNAGSIYNTMALMALDTAIYAATNHGIFRSFDNGVNWAAMPNSGSNNVRSFVLSQGKLLAGAGNGILLYDPTDDAWEPTANSVSGSICYVLTRSDSILFAGTSVGVFASKNNENDWMPMNEGMGAAEIASMATFGQYLYAGTWGGGVWRRKLSDFITGVQDHSPILRGGSFDAFPNPFGQATTLRCWPGRPGPASLRIVDACGREMFSWADVALAPDPQRITWDAAGLPSGIYLCILRTPDKVETLKLVKTDH